MLCAALYATMLQPSPELPTLQDQQRRAIVAKVAEHLRQGYVFPKLADEAAVRIASLEEGGKYRSLATPAAFAERLSRDLREVTRDGHLAVVVDRSKHETSAKDPVAEWEAAGREANGGITEVRILPGNVGYLRVTGLYDPAIARPAIGAAFVFLQNTRALVLDLRDNGGGHPETGGLITAHFVPAGTVTLRFEYRPERKTMEDPTPEATAGPRYLDRPVAVLVGRRTYSGGEAIAYGLQSLKRAKVYGTRSGGAANPWEPRSLPHGFMLQLPSGRPVSPITGTNWEGVGVLPDVPVSKGDPIERARLDLISQAK